VIFTNAGTSFLTPRTLTLNHPEDFTFTNRILTTTFTDGSAAGQRGALVIGLTVNGATNTVTLTANNTYVDGTTINGGTLQVGNGGATGAIGTGPVVDNTALIFNRSGSLSVPGVISGGGNIVQIGNGTVTLSASNTVTGNTTISNGTLVVSSSVNGNLNVQGGTLAAGGLNAVTGGAMHVGGAFNIFAGTVAVSLNRSLAPSNTLITADGGVNYTAGTLKLVNGGPTLKVGDTFQIFSAPVTGGAGIPIVSSGFTVANNLAVDGSVMVTFVAQPPAPTISKATLQGGTNIVITATNNFGPGGTWSLLATNTLSAPLATWPVINSGDFGSTGSIAVTNAVSTNRMFFILRAQ
jgi:fibronectin-binding autotransporter adhesin